MRKCTDEEMVLLATSIAMELAKGLDADEIEELKNLVNQISCSLSSLICCRYSCIKRNDKIKK